MLGRVRTLLVAALVGWSGSALADPIEEAAQLKKEGDDLVHALHYREALQKYDRAWELGHDPAILYNRGRALDALGETPLALDAFEQFAKVAPPDLQAKVPNFEQLLADVRSRVATIVIRCSVEGATVLVRKKLEGKTPLQQPIRAAVGDAAIAIEAPGYKPFNLERKLESGENVIEVTLEKEAETPKPDATPLQPAPVHTELPETRSGLKWAGLATAGVGVLGIGAGAIFGGLTFAKQGEADPHCPGKVCDAIGSKAVSDGRTFGAVSTVSFIVGGVALAAGVVLFLVQPKQRQSAFEPFVLGGTW